MPLQDITADDDRLLQDIADKIASSHRIILITGAGISTSCGITDFRSKDGLYNIIPAQVLPPTPPPSAPSTPSRKRKASMDDDQDPPSSQSSTSSRKSTPTSSKLRGQDLFNSRVFQTPESTATFYQFIASLRRKIRTEVESASATHKFIRTLRDGGRLMRCYTQNIDGLEAREGLCMDLASGKGSKRRFMKKNYEVPLPATRAGTDFDGGCEVVQLHGDLETLRCNMCAAQTQWTDEETDIYLEGAAPKCERCSNKNDERQATGKRGLAVGSLRPNVVLYGEDHPNNSLLVPFIPYDVASQPDTLIIMGTSLKVFGLQQVVRQFAKAVHNQKNGKGRVIFVNRTRPAESVWDGIIDDFVAMDCDDWVEETKKHRPDIWLRQGDLNLKLSKPSTQKRKSKVLEDLSNENSSSTEERPAKKTKILIEIPSKSMQSTKSTKPTTEKRTKPKSLASQQEQSDKYEKIENSTAWRKETGTPTKPQIRRLVRPTPSPLSKSFKMIVQARNNLAVPGSPKTPPFSPITPRVLGSSKLRNSWSGDRAEKPTPLLSALINIDNVVPAGNGDENEEQRVERLVEEADTATDEQTELVVAGSPDTDENVNTPSHGRGGRTINHLDGAYDQDVFKPSQSWGFPGVGAGLFTRMFG